MYDAIVIGARCAGAPLAMVLARKGYRVLAVDRDTFPSDTLSTSYLQGEALERLKRWGLFEAVVATGAPMAPTVARFGGMSVPLGPPGALTMAPRRTYLDAVLVEGARAAGAEVREGFSVLAVLRDGEGRVAGIRGRGPDGATVEETARVVIGADGRNSLLARSVEAAEYHVHEPTSVGYYSYYTGIEAPEHRLEYLGRHVFFTFPTNDGQACVAMEAPSELLDEIRPDPEGYMQRKMDELLPELGAHFRAAARVERVYGMTGRRSLYREPSGPGWVLVGDAGFLKDPVTGMGVDDAFRDADQAAEALGAWLSGREPFEEALGRFHRQRDEATLQRYQQTCFLAELHEVTPQFLRVLAQAAGATATPPA